MLYGLKEILNLYNVKALKNLSQNFIFDQALLKKIVSVGSAPSSDSVVIEIGPAAGNLTRALLSRGHSKILIIEKDTRFKPIIEQLVDYSAGKINFKFADALDLDETWLPPSWFESLDPPKKLQIIGNLPFAVATPLTLNLIKQFTLMQQGLFKKFDESEMIFMFQNEVAKKFSAKVGTKNYGRLAVMAHSVCDVSYEFPIRSAKFTPQPKVDSGLVKFKFIPKDKVSTFFKTENAFEKLESLTQMVFRHKNKKLSSIQLPWSELGIDPNLRPVHLSPEELIKIAQNNVRNKPL